MKMKPDKFGIAMIIATVLAVACSGLLGCGRGEWKVEPCENWKWRVWHYQANGSRSGSSPLSYDEAMWYAATRGGRDQRPEHTYMVVYQNKLSESKMEWGNFYHHDFGFSTNNFNGCVSYLREQGHTNVVILNVVKLD